MSRITSEKNTAEYDATDRSGVEILADGACNRNLLTIVGLGGDFTAGTVAVYIKGRGSRRYLAMKDAYGNAVSINLATADAVMIDKPIGSVRLDVSGISGATGWKAVLSGIDEPMSVASSSVPGPVIIAEQDSAVFTASASSASVLFTVDMTNWNSLLLQVTSAGSSCTITYETSNDQSAWAATNVTVSGITTTTSVPVTSSTITTGSFQVSKRGKYIRARVSVYGSGAVSVVYALSASTINTVVGASVWGSVGEGSTASGNPVAIGVETRTSNKTSVGNGQIVRPIGTVDGKMIIRQHSIPENEWSYVAASGGILNTTTAVTLKTAAGAPYRNYLTSIQVQAEALANATEIAVRDGAGGTVLWRIKIPTTGLDLKQIDFADPLKSSSATLLEVVTLTASGTGAVYVNAQGYVAP